MHVQTLDNMNYNLNKPLAVPFMDIIIPERLVFHIPVELFKNPQTLTDLFTLSTASMKRLSKPTTIPANEENIY